MCQKNGVNIDLMKKCAHHHLFYQKKKFMISRDYLEVVSSNLADKSDGHVKWGIKAISQCHIRETHFSGSMKKLSYVLV